MAIYFDSRYTSDMRDEVKEELLAVAAQAANSAKAAERERCAKIVVAELAQWNRGGEYYANLTQACSTIATKIRSGE